MATSSVAPSEDTLAEQLVSRFVRRFEPAYKWLLYYAALPLVLTPELLNYLHNQFLREKQIPWVAEVDLLLSDLCTSVGDEQYAMLSPVRAYLIRQAEEVLTLAELEQVALLLIRYIKKLEQTNQYLTARERRDQRWAAMVFMEAGRGEVVQEIAQAFQSCATPDDGQPTAMSLASQTEISKLSRITETLSPQLTEHAELVRYARSVAQALRNADMLSPEQLDQEYQVGDITLTIPDPLKPQPPGDRLDGIPPLQEFEFESAKISFVENGREFVLQTQTLDVGWFEVEADEANEGLQPFEFETATIEGGEIRKRSAQGTQFAEGLSDEISLEMVAIPGGEFLMGAPAGEANSHKDERPVHSVAVAAFFMAKTPVTQAQWRAVARLDQVNRELNPAPSRFDADDLPVEQVSWDDAVEFCDRLSAHTGRTYVLPSEAQWEYACRARTQTSYAFGESITKELANYDGDSTSQMGRYPANPFGLYDMHGNVWEWCLDDWHGNYEGAPEDGSAWLSSGKGSSKVLRGGSWVLGPRRCRSAYRDDDDPDYRRSRYGFRVVCLPQDSA